ncbi:hypothetical protein D3C81_1789440 [compost metagenome]
MDAQEYRALAASSGGYQHGGETKMHNHENQHDGQKEATSGHRHDAGGTEEFAEADVHCGDTSGAHAPGDVLKAIRRW